MKANVSRALKAALALPMVLALVSSCSDRRVVPTPAPTGTPAPPPPRPAIDWEHAPATPGDWQWSNAGGRSQATFAQGLLQLRCQGGNVVLSRRGSADRAVPMTISTSAMTRTVDAQATAAGIQVAFAARDPLLDAMAFSRGHFAVEVPGVAAVYAPSWPEVSRVIEDCR
ncbi:MAG: hypothetical protein KDE25_14435 [Novosphingobium sp.]|nr:hypothetical protein [Novosphingobium sp.]